MAKTSRLAERLVGEDRRKQARYRLVLRAGILEQGDSSAFCLVRNISSSGVQLKIYAQPLVGARARLRVADQEPVTGTLLWASSGVAGMQFDEELDATVLAGVQRRISADRRRAVPRMSIDGSARLRTCGMSFKAKVCDISSLGARVCCPRPLATGDRVILEFCDLPPIEAYVRWAARSDAGLVFRTPIPMQIIVHWISARTRIIA